MSIPSDLGPADRRLPRAGLDPICDPETALGIIRHAAHRPARAETIVLTLDDARCGVHIVVIADTTSDDHVLEVAEYVFEAAAASDVITEVIVASIRPGRSDAAGATDPDLDARRWLELDQIAEELGVDLIEWFVIGETTDTPRTRVDDPSRW